MWRGKYYMPTCLVLGLASAPRVSTKVMRPMMAFMRSLGVRVPLEMIDDYLWAARPEACGELLEAVLTVLPGLGSRLIEKCELTPQDEVLMLGMLTNALLSQVRAPPKKIDKTVVNIDKLLQKHERQQAAVTIQHVQRVTGRLMSMMLAYAGTRIYTRSLYRIIAVAVEENDLRSSEGRPRC
jgi:hypothetical protein